MIDARRVHAQKASRISRSALAAALLLSVSPRFAAAEVYDPLRGYGLDGSPIARERAQPERRAAPADQAAPSDASHRAAPTYVSTATVRRIASRGGFRLIDQPRRRGRSFFAMAEDDKGHRFRLVFNAYSGQIVDRTDVTVADAKPPVSSTPSAAPAVETAVKPKESVTPAKAIVAEPKPTAVAAVPAIAAPVPAPPAQVSPPAAAPLAAAIPSPPLPPAAVAAPAPSAPSPVPPSSPVPLSAPAAALAVVAAPVVGVPVVEAPVVAAQPEVPTPATPPTSFAALNPCEVPQRASSAATAPLAAPTPSAPANPTVVTAKAPPADMSVAAAPPPKIVDTAPAAGEPYSGPTPVYADAPPAVSTTAPADTANAPLEIAPKADVAPKVDVASKAEADSVHDNSNSPPEPYSGPTPVYADQVADPMPSPTGSIQPTDGQKQPPHDDGKP